MATQFAQLVQPVVPVPFLLGEAPSVSSRRGFADALHRAAAAATAGPEVRSSRQQVALLLCELGKTYGCESEFPLSRAALASALGLTLVRVKRTLALFALSGVISCDADCIEVLDWRKLSAAAGFDAAALNLDELEEDEELPLCQEDEAHFFTACGEPACFL